PPIPGIGTAGGVTFMLLDRTGHDVAFLADNTTKFIEEASKRPEIMRASTTFTDDVPQVFVDVDREKAMKQGGDLSSVYQTVQAFMVGSFINDFSRFGRQWQVYLQAEGDYRTAAGNVGQFYVRNNKGDAVPLSSLITIRRISGPEYTQRYNLRRAA